MPVIAENIPKDLRACPHPGTNGTDEFDLREYGVDPGEKPKPNPKPPARLVSYRPFPTEVLPGVVAKFVRIAAESIGCDESYVALPAIATLAGAIGNSRVVLLKRGWTEPSVVWTAIVGDSGTMKSPALDAPLKAVRKKQNEAFEQYEQEMREHEARVLRHESAVAAWKFKAKKGSDEPPPDAPEEPVCIRYWISDTTVEALAKNFPAAPRGLLLSRDELAGWLKSFDQYKGGKGGDTAHWLSMHGARDLLVDRKSGGTTYVRRAALSLTGGIQPEIFRKALSREHFEDGLAARILVCMPPRKHKRWSMTEVPEELNDEFGGLVESLYALEMNVDRDGRPEPAVLPLTDSAMELWQQFYNEHGDEQAKASGDLASALSKLEGYAARLALVVQLVSNPSSRCVDAQAMQAGILLARWFMQECRRVYAVLGETEEDTDRRRMIELIRRQGGSITARDLAHNDRRFGNDSGAAKAALDAMVEKGFGRWEFISPGPKGGRPTEAFRLNASREHDDACHRNPTNSAEKEGFGYGDGRDTSETDGDEVCEWNS